MLTPWSAAHPAGCGFFYWKEQYVKSRIDQLWAEGKIHEAQQEARRAIAEGEMSAYDYPLEIPPKLRGRGRRAATMKRIGDIRGKELNDFIQFERAKETNEK
jgi:hypothetical protein